MRVLFWLMISAWLLQPAHAQDVTKLGPLTAPTSGDQEADNACAMMAAYAKMGVADAQIKPLV